MHRVARFGWQFGALPPASLLPSYSSAMETPIDTVVRLTRLEDAIIALAIVVSEGHLAHLDAANMSPDVVAAGKRLQEFHRIVTDERKHRHP